MTGLTTSELFKLRSSILALSEECPVDHCNPADCPLHAFRQMSPEQRVEWLRALSPDELAYLVAYHHVCMHAKFHASHPVPR